MKTLIFAVAVGVTAFLGLRLLAPTPSWEEIGEKLGQTLNDAARLVIGKGDTKVGPIVPAIPTVPAYGGPFQAGQEVEVANTGGCLRVRIYPSFDAPTWTCLPEGTRLKIVLSPLYADGIWWWAAERQGWVAEPYLSPVVAGEEEPLIAQGVAAHDRGRSSARRLFGSRSLSSKHGPVRVGVALSMVKALLTVPSKRCTPDPLSSYAFRLLTEPRWRLARLASCSRAAASALSGGSLSPCARRAQTTRKKPVGWASSVAHARRRTLNSECKGEGQL